MSDAPRDSTLEIIGVDVGNSHTVIGLFQGSKLFRTWRVHTHPVRTEDELRALGRTLFELAGVDPNLHRPVIISSVVPQATAVLKRSFPGQIVYVVDHRAPFSFKIEAFPPDQVGADRLVNAEAAVREVGGPAIIIDSGTATTVCAISKDGSYLGGAILAGIEGTVELLARRAAKLYAVDLVRPERAIGRNTTEAIQSGILLGYASMIDGMVKRFREELGIESCPVIATGGVSVLMTGLVKEVTIWDPDLTLKGLRYLYESFSHRESQA